MLNATDIEHLLSQASKLRCRYERLCAVRQHLGDGWYNEAGAERAKLTIASDTAAIHTLLTDIKALLDHYPEDA